MVSEITKDSSAEAAGLRSNDIFISMDGRAIANCDALVNQIQDKAPGDRVKIVVSRNTMSSVTVHATLLSRDEVLRKRFGGLPMPATRLVRVDDRREIDISNESRQTTIIGWYPTSCAGCEQLFTKVAKWSREERRGGTAMPIKVAAATAGDTRMPRSIVDNLELLKGTSRLLDVPLLVTDDETYKHFTIGDTDRAQFMVIDCRGIVQYAAFVLPTADDQEAVLDELYAAAEQAARRMK